MVERLTVIFKEILQHDAIQTHGKLLKYINKPAPNTSTNIDDREESK